VAVEIAPEGWFGAAAGVAATDVEIAPGREIDAHAQWRVRWAKIRLAGVALAIASAARITAAAVYAELSRSGKVTFEGETIPVQ
jgi:hypothetical protein